MPPATRTFSGATSTPLRVVWPGERIGLGISLEDSVPQLDAASRLLASLGSVEIA